MWSSSPPLDDLVLLFHGGAGMLSTATARLFVLNRFSARDPNVLSRGRRHRTHAILDFYGHRQKRLLHVDRILS